MGQHSSGTAKDEGSTNDRTAKESDYVEGSKVWVYVPKTYKGLSKKLLHNYHGPYWVVKKLSPVRFRLRTCSNRPVSSIVHANRMKPFVDPRDWPLAPPPDIDDDLCLEDQDLPSDSFIATHTNTDTTSNLSPTTDPTNVRTHATTTSATDKNHSPDNHKDQDTKSEALIDNDTIFNAERLLKTRTRDGKVQYLVKWVGYPESEATWEPVSHILDPRLIDDFHTPTDK